MIESRIVHGINVVEQGLVEVVWMVLIDGIEHHRYSGFYTPETALQFEADVSREKAEPFMNTLKEEI